MKKEVLYQVRCPKGHEFQKTIPIVEDSEKTETSDMQAYCPVCDEMVEFTVEGEVILNTEVERKFNEQNL